MAATKTNLEALESNFLLTNTEAAAAALLGAMACSPLLYEGPTKRIHAINGVVVEVTKQPPVRSYVAGSVDSLVELAGPESTIWHAGDTVLLEVDGRLDQHAAGKVTWVLNRTEAWNTAIKGLKGAPQKSVIRLLDVFLRKAVEKSEAAQALLAAVRVMKFSSQQTSTGAVQPGRQSMGREITAEARGVTDLPPWVQLAPQRWAEFPDFTVSLELLVDVDPTEETFEVRPTVDEVEAAERVAQAHLHDYLCEKLSEAGKAEAVAVYHGMPAH